MALTAEQIEQYHQDGILVVRQLLNAEELEELRTRADEIASGKAEHIPENYVQVEPGIAKQGLQVQARELSIRKLHHLHSFDDVMWRHAASPKILDMVQDLLGTADIKIYNDQLFMKPAHHGSRKCYHQDSNSWIMIAPMDLVSCWAALDGATLENGCLRVLRGSHRWGHIGRDREVEIDNQALEGRLAEQGLEELPVELEAGDCSFHHSLLLHSSHPNNSPHRRRGYVTHYMRATSKFVGKGEPPQYLQARGRSFAGCV